MKTVMATGAYQKQIREKTPLMNICEVKNKVTQPPVTLLLFPIFKSVKM